MQPESGNSDHLLSDGQHDSSSNNASNKNWWSTLASNKKWQTVTAVVAVVVVGAVGATFLSASHADTVIVGSIEGENMSITKGKGTVVNISGGQAMKLTGNDATAVGTINTTRDITGVEFRVRGEQCQGAPQVRVLLDDKQVLRTTVKGSSFHTYSENISYAKGSHKLTVKLLNYANVKGKNCSRDVDVDVTNLDGASGPADVAPPTVSLVSPVDGSTVREGVSVYAKASDDIGVTKVEFYANGKLLDTEIFTPYAYTWDTKTVSDGDYAIVARAYDAAGNVGTSATANVKVANSSVVVTPGSAPFLAYLASSFFRTPLGKTWPIDSTSATGIAYAKANDPNKFPMLLGAGGNQNGVGFAVGTCNDPVWKFDASAHLPQGQSFLTSLGFHAPAGWEKTIPTGTNPTIEVVDTCGNTARPKGFTVWGSNVAYDGNTAHVLKASGSNTALGLVGGSFSHDTNGLNHGVLNSNDTADLNETTRGNIPDAFAIRDDLLKYGMTGGNGGTLGHVLQINWVQTDSTMGHVAPMTGEEAGKTGYGAEGERIALKPTWTAPSTCSGAALVVAKTLQTYGAYIANNSGSGSNLKVQQGSTMLTPNALSSCFTWDDMAFVQRGWSASW